MNLDEMKDGWKKQNEKLAADQFDSMVIAAQERASKFEKSVFRRDMIEIAAAIFVIGFLGAFLAINSMPAPMTVGLVLIIIASVEIIVVMTWTRKRDSRPDADASVIDYSQAEIARLERQINLMRKITLWYSAPIFVGISVFLGGVLHFTKLPILMTVAFSIGFAIAFFAAGFIIHRMQRDAINSELLPLREQLQELLMFADEQSTN